MEDDEPGSQAVARTRTLLRATAGSAVATMVVTFPVFLTAALSVPIRADLGFSELGLGLGVSTFFGVSALSSVAGGWLAQRIGARASVALGASLSLLATASLGLLAGRLLHVVILLGLAGAANAIAQPGAGLVLAEVVPVHRQGLAFGVSQVSAPLAALLAGVTMPTIALTIGWRWAFVVPALFGAVLAAVWPRADARPGVAARPQDASRPVRTRRRGRRQPRDLLILAGATTAGSMAVQAMTAFFIESAVAAGLAPGTAGWLLGAGSMCGVAARVVYGWGADRLGGDRLRDVALLMLIGAAGVLALAAQSQALLTPATVLAFAAGWGWNGLFNHAVVRRYPAAPAMALGVATTGIFIGGAAGPLTFGAIASHAGYPAAWAAAAAMLLLAGVLVWLAARAAGSPQPRQDRERERPAAPGS
jgi:MFS family permease